MTTSMAETSDTSTSETSSFTFSLPVILEENLEARSNNFQLQLQEGPTPSRPQTEINHLRSNAEQMYSKGCLDQFINEYVSERKSLVMFRFRKLWDEKLRTTDIQRLEWEVLEEKIKQWLLAAHLSFWDIFAIEKRLSKYVFLGLGDHAADESCFLAIITEPVTELLSFVEALCCCHRSPVRLHRILLLYARFSCLISDINFFLGASEEVKINIQGRVDGVRSSLAEVVRLTILDFEAAILGDLDNCPTTRGNVHRSTECVMNYTINILEIKQSLMELIISKPSFSSGDVAISESEVAELESRTPLAAHLLWIIIILRLNLERKSKYYGDQALANLFMMNNLHYVVLRIRQSEVLREMVGGYLNKLSENVEEAMNSYLRETLAAVVYSIGDEEMSAVCCNFLPWAHRKGLKGRLNTFNTLFERILRTQTTWAVPDLKLRKELHQSILDKLIPPYRKFTRHIAWEKRLGRERYIMYSDQELKQKVLDMFSFP